MMRTWRMLGLSTLLAAALTAGPAVAEANAADEKPPTLEDIQKQLKAIQESLKPLADVPKDLKSAKDDVLRSQGDIAVLQRQMLIMQRDIEDLRKQVNEKTRISGFQPLGASGRIRLMNTYTMPMSIRVNDRVYRLEPGQTQMLENQSIGAFTYEVIGVQGATIRELRANEVYTIYVYPR